MNTVEIITIQGKDVLDKILSEGIYYADTETYIASSETKSNLLKPYQYLSHEYGYKHFPIFGCVVGHYCEFWGANTVKNSVLLHLSVPRDEVKVQDYYDWVDLIFFMENPQEWNKKDGPIEQFFRNVLYTEDLQQPSRRPRQITIECIKKEWVLDTCTINQKFIKYHYGSGGSNVLLKLSAYK